MKPRSVLGLALLAGAASMAEAQSANCPGGPPGSPAQVTQDACQKAVDLFQYMAPQLGGAITGGNATLGRGGTLGGLGHFSVGVRVNVIQGSVPKINDPAVQPVITGARVSNFNTSDTPLPMPTIDGAIGVFAGFPLGITNVGGIDALISASYIPKVSDNSVTIEPDNPVRFGAGVRVGLIQESIFTPGVSFTFIRRDLPRLKMTGTVSGATLHVNDFDEGTYAWRFVASKNLIFFGFALGIGQDKYQSDATAFATGTVGTLGVTSPSIDVSQEMARTNVFGDLSFNMPIVKFVVEGGEVTGGAQPTIFNTFSGRGIVAARWYGSLGLRFAW